MREYARISPTFWTGETGKALRARGPEAIVVAFYLMTCPMSHMLGLYSLPMHYITHDTGLPLEGASKGLRACEEVGFAKYDPETETVWVVEMASWQVARELKATDNRVIGVRRDYQSMPKSPFLEEFFIHYGGPLRLEEARVFEGAPKPLRSKEKEKEKEQEKEKSIPPSALSISGEMDLAGPKPEGDQKEARLRVVTTEAIAAFNASKLVKANGGRLANVREGVGLKRRMQQVKRVLGVAMDISLESLGTKKLTLEFWADYFETISEDPWLSGKQKGGPGHENWIPDFEFLMREKTMLRVFDNAEATP